MPNENELTLNSLVVSLEAELGFEKDPSGKWVMHDEMECIGDYGQYEVLPARTRVSINGTRYEAGARREDLEGLLALAKIVNKDAQGLGAILNFWKESKVFSAKEEDGWIYIGRNIEPTTESFEVAFNAGGLAFGIAVSAAILNRTYHQMKEKKGFNEVAYSENPTGRSVLFGPSIFDTLEGNRAPEDLARHSSAEHSHNQHTRITAANLSEYPLHSPDTWLHFCPGTIIRHGKSKIRKDISICGYNGSPEVFISSLEAGYDTKNDIWNHDNVRLVLPIPDGIEIKTISDIVQLKYAKLLGDNFEVSKEMNVGIKVEPSTIYLKSEEGDLVLIIREPKCDNCETPVWRFPSPQDRAVAGASIKGLYQTNTSLGILRYLVSDGGKQKTYCGNCIGDFLESYVKRYPNADVATARKFALDQLKVMGYDMIDLPENGDLPREKGVMFTAIIKYQRDGREIIRVLGNPTITHDGVFTPNMKPMEFVNFRYAAK